MPLKSQLFGVSGTFNVPGGVDTVLVQALGGGGGGGSSLQILNAAGGGGSGELQQNRWIPVTPGSAITITVGVAGSAGINGVAGGDGGTSSFGTKVIARGGQGGLPSAAAYGGHGGGQQLTQGQVTGTPPYLTSTLTGTGSQGGRGGDAGLGSPGVPGSTGAGGPGHFGGVGGAIVGPSSGGGGGGAGSIYGAGGAGGSKTSLTPFGQNGFPAIGLASGGGASSSIGHGSFNGATGASGQILIMWIA